MNKMVSEESINDASISNRSILLKRFSGLHEYLCLLGEHINQIDNNLEKIENTLTEIRNKYNSTIESDKTELKEIKDILVTKNEVMSILQELNDIIKGAYPQLTPIPKIDSNEI